MAKRPSDFSKELREQIRSIVQDLQHHGASGGSIEKILRTRLRDYIPLRFGIHNGFIRSLDFPDWESHELDLIFTNDWYSQPLAVYPTHSIFPIEAVIGIMEVTKTFSQKKMRKDFAKAEEVQRCVGGNWDVSLNVVRHLIPPEKLPPLKNEMADRITQVRIHWGDLHPRFFYFAASSTTVRHETI